MLVSVSRCRRTIRISSYAPRRAIAIISLAPAVPGLMAENATFIASGIIDSRKDEVIAALEAAGLPVQEVKEKRGWECIICKKSN